MSEYQKTLIIVCDGNDHDDDPLCDARGRFLDIKDCYYLRKRLRSSFKFAESKRLQPHSEVEYSDPAPLKRAPGYVYIIEDYGAKMFKIGHTRNPEVRMTAIRSVNPSIESDPFIFRGSVATERLLHKTFDSKRTTGEWFKLTMEERSEAIQIILTHDPLKQKSTC